VTVLAIETATTVCAAAVVRDAMVVGESSLCQKYVHAERLMGMIDEVLCQASLSPRDVDGIAVSIGPGSFTGLRIGLSVAKGLAYSLTKPIVAVPTLESLAQRALDAGAVQSSGFILAVLEARREEVYCQLFQIEGNALVQVWQARDLAIGNLVKELGSRTVTVTGEAKSKVADAVRAAGADVNATIRCVDDALSLCSAGSVGKIGERLLRSDAAADAVTLEPLYVKEFSSSH